MTLWQPCTTSTTPMLNPVTFSITTFITIIFPNVMNQQRRLDPLWRFDNSVFLCMGRTVGQQWATARWLFPPLKDRVFSLECRTFLGTLISGFSWGRKSDSRLVDLLTNKSNAPALTVIGGGIFPGGWLKLWSSPHSPPRILRKAISSKICSMSLQCPNMVQGQSRKGATWIAGTWQGWSLQWSSAQKKIKAQRSSHYKICNRGMSDEDTYEHCITTWTPLK